MEIKQLGNFVGNLKKLLSPLPTGEFLSLFMAWTFRSFKFYINKWKYNKTKTDQRYSSSKPTWTCPVCNKPADFFGLCLDGLFVEILKESKDDEIEFVQNGTWRSALKKSDVVLLDTPIKPPTHSIGNLSFCFAWFLATVRSQNSNCRQRGRVVKAPGLLSTWSCFKTYSRHSVASLGKTLYGTFPCLVVLASSYKLSHISLITSGQQYLGISGSRSG